VTSTVPAGPASGGESGARQVKRQPPTPRAMVISCLVLTLLMAIAAIVAAVVGYERYGGTGVVTAGVAATTCWLASLTALVLVGLTTATPNAMSGLFGAMGLRTGIPLIVAFVLAALSPTLANAGIVGMFLVFFLVSLTVETTLSVVIVSTPSPGPKPSADPEASSGNHG